MNGDARHDQPLRIAALIVSYNRRQTTLNAIDNLVQVSGQVPLTIVLFDDGSTDGTAEAVRESFPEVILMHGDGSFFWNKGLNHAWREALNHPVDAFLWLNDDVVLDPDAFEKLVTAWDTVARSRPDRNFILVGATRGSQQEVTYGGQVRRRSILSFKISIVTPGSDLIGVDTFNGNFVLVPREVTEWIGLNDPAYHHNFGDVDYGLRARHAGMEVLLLPGTVGVCERNASKTEQGYGSARLSLAEQWRKVGSHHGLPLRSWYRFTKQHSGLYFPFHFLGPYRHLFIPRRVRSFFGGKQLRSEKH